MLLSWLVALLLPSLSVGQGLFAAGSFNLTLYRQMPALYRLDDYDLCRDRLGGVYCLVYVEIAPNGSSRLWQQIEEVSLDFKHRFRHDRLFRGVCVDNCTESLQSLGNPLEVHDTELVSYYSRVHRRVSDADERLLHGPVINSCLNREFEQEFSLQVRTFVEYCVKAEDKPPYDALDVGGYILVAFILLLTAFSSIYDNHLKSCQSQKGLNFYRLPLTIPRQQILTCFSLARNYQRLVQPHSSDLSRDVSFFDGFRVIAGFVVILGHTLMLFMTVPIENPEFYEQFLFRVETSIFQNGSLVIQIFFVMSGFLLYVNFTERQLVNPKTGILACVAAYFRVFFNRYLRLLPSLLLLILFNSTWMSRLQDGPFWRHLSEAERVFCRQNWWKNVLFVTNHMMEDSCSHQTWYLGADMQLFELFLIVLVITNKHTQLVKIVYVALVIAAFAVPAALTYILELEAVYHLRPETYRYLYFRHSETFYQMYPPFYTNLGGYLCGFLCGHLYLIRRSCSEKIQGRLRYELALWLLVPCALGLLFSGYLFMRHDFAKPSIWLALYAGLHKNLWVLICAGFVFLMSCKVGGLAYAFCKLPVFRPLARISFQAFLWHIVVLRLVAGHLRQPVHVDSFTLVCNVLAVFVLTQMVAFFVALLLEYPLSELLRCLLNPSKAVKEVRNSEIQLERGPSAGQSDRTENQHC